MSDDEYFLNVMQYIEQNPVRAKMVVKISDHPWSSYKLNCKKDDTKLIDRNENKMWLQLAENTKGRISKYKQLMEKVLNDIRKSTQFGTPYVSEKFKDQIAKMLPLKRKRGRPRKIEIK